MSGQKERLTIVNQSIDWNGVEYMDADGNPIDGIIPLNRPDKLAGERVYGLNTVRLGDQVWVVDGSGDAGSTLVHLEELELEKKSVKWEEKVEKPEESTCPECGAATSEGVKCGFCGVGLKTVPGTKMVEKPIDQVIARETLEPVLTGGVGEIKEYLTEQLDEESGGGESTVFDQVWDGMMKSAGEAGEGLKDMLVGILPEAMASIIKNIPAESLINFMGADRLKQMVRETMVGAMLAGETVQSGAQGLISNIPGLAELVDAKGELALYGPFHENEINDGRIVVVKDGDENKAAAMAEKKSLAKEIMAVPPGLKLLEVPVKEDVVLDSKYILPVRYSTLVNSDLDDQGLMMIYAINDEGNPINLFIPMSHLEKWDIRQNGVSMWDELERIAQAGEVKSHTFGNLSANYVTEGYPTPRFALTRMGVIDRAYVNVSWKPGMEVVRRKPVEPVPAKISDYKSAVAVPAPEVAEAKPAGEAKKEVEKPTTPLTVLELARKFEQLGMPRAGLLLREEQAKIRKLEVVEAERIEDLESSRWFTRWLANRPTDTELTNGKDWLEFKIKILNEIFGNVSTPKELNIAWKNASLRAARWLADHHHDYPDQWRTADGKTTTYKTAYAEYEELLKMLESWSDGKEPSVGWKTPVDMVNSWCKSSRRYVNHVGRWGNHLGNHMLEGE